MNWFQGPESNSVRNRGFWILSAGWAEMPLLFGCQGQGFRLRCHRQTQPSSRSKAAKNEGRRFEAYSFTVAPNWRLTNESGSSQRYLPGGDWRGETWSVVSCQRHVVGICLSGCIKASSVCNQTITTGSLCAVDRVARRRQSIPIGPVGGALMCLLLHFRRFMAVCGCTTAWTDSRLA
jgi:hypothetical protein